MSTRTALRDLKPEAAKLGFHFEGLTMRGHLKWRHASGAIAITISKADTDRLRQNALSELRKIARRAGTMP